MIAIDAWYPAEGLTLEPNALRAAKEEEHSLALTAGPGAGKTEMLAQRADFLLRTGCSRYPKRILAISFKVDASKNLKERVLRRCGANLTARFDSYTFHAFAKHIIDRFRPLLSGDNGLDVDYKIGDKKIPRKQIKFDDLIPLALQILQQSAVVRKAIRQTYSDVFLDEFQDCTSQQYELVKIVFQGTSTRLTAVGDTKQKIMGWAGALDGIFKEFATDFAAIPLHMYRNFRSQPRLLRLQNEIIRVLDIASVMPETALMGEGGEVFTQCFSDSLKEAKYLAVLIENWIRSEQIPASEIAVLVSKQLDLYANHLMAELESLNIPYRNEQQMQDISTEPVARLIVDYLSCLYGLREPKAWGRLMDQLSLFSDDDIYAKFQQFIGMQRQSSKYSPQDFSGWQGAVDEFLIKFKNETLAAFSPDYESPIYLEEIIKNTKTRIEELLILESNLPKTLQRFSDDQAVRILTIHKSKGLEFDSVIIMAVENEIFFGDQNENRRAFFVGVSRAKRRLVLTYANRRERPPECTTRWDISRTAQKEYFDYATLLLNTHS